MVDPAGDSDRIILKPDEDMLPEAPCPKTTIID